MDKKYNIGTHIRDRRKFLGMSQEKLAELSKLSVNYISRLELAKDTNLSINALIAISTALDVNVSELLLTDAQKSTELPYYLKRLIDELLTFDADEANEISELLLSLVRRMK